MINIIITIITITIATIFSSCMGSYDVFSNLNTNETTSRVVTIPDHKMPKLGLKPFSEFNDDIPARVVKKIWCENNIYFLRKRARNRYVHIVFQRRGNVYYIVGTWNEVSSK